MKILQVNKFFHLKGGSEAYLFSLIRELRQQGHSVAEFAMRHPLNQPSDWSDYFVKQIDYNTRKLSNKIVFALKIIYSFEAKEKIGKLIEEFKPNLVHLHLFQHQLSASIIPEIKKKNIPIIYTAHDLKCICPNYRMLTKGKICERCKGHKYYNCYFYKCTKNSFLKSFVNSIEMYLHHFMKYYDLIDLIITPSYFYKKKLIEFRFPNEKVIHIPNFIDLELLKPNYAHNGYFLYFGRLSEEKGLVTLIESMKNVKKGKLVIVGIGPLKRLLRKKVKLLGLLNIEFLGFQSGESLKEIVKNCLFTILPSEWYENGPMSLLESFAYGKPVIGSNIGGIPEHITHREDGLIFNPGDCEDLSKKINEMTGNPSEIIRMGKNARYKAERLYSKSQHVKKILEIYDQVIKATRSNKAVRV